MYDFHVNHTLRTVEEKVQDLFIKFDNYIDTHKYIKNAAIEGMQVWQNSLVSMTAATRGDLSLLSYIIGAYAASCIRHGITLHLPSPQWKGQLTYDALAIWVKRITGIEYSSEHCLAAAGMGLSLSGRLL
jgi:hypothetical protein